MGYFDAMVRGTLMTTEDGRRVFLPWGVFGPAYIVPSEQEFERLGRLVKAYLIVSLSLAFLLVMWGTYLELTAFVLVSCVLYGIWAQIECRRLRRSVGQPTRDEAFTLQTRAWSRATLWLFEVVSLAFVALGFVLLALDPGNWLIAVTTIAFFGLCAAVYAKMLIVKRRDRRQPS